MGRWCLARGGPAASFSVFQRSSSSFNLPWAWQPASFHPEDVWARQENRLAEPHQVSVWVRRLVRYCPDSLQRMFGFLGISRCFGTTRDCRYRFRLLIRTEKPSIFDFGSLLLLYLATQFRSHSAWIQSLALCSVPCVLLAPNSSSLSTSTFLLHWLKNCQLPAGYSLPRQGWATRAERSLWSRLAIAQNLHQLSTRCRIQVLACNLGMRHPVSPR